MHTWTQLHIHEPTTEEDVCKEMLWDNSYILINKRTISWPTWKDKGIIVINDLLHDVGPRFLSHTELADKYGLQVSFLEILQIRTAIPCGWKQKILNPAVQGLTIKIKIYTKNGQILELSESSSKDLRKSSIHPWLRNSFPRLRHKESGRTHSLSQKWTQRTTGQKSTSCRTK